MTHEDLAAALDELNLALDTASDEEIRERLDQQSEYFEVLTDANPDHGRMARHEHFLRSIAHDADDEVADHVEQALDRIQDYRQTVEGV